MSKSEGGPTNSHVSVRLAKSEVARVDALVNRCSTPWRKGTRSDVLRLLVIYGLERAEQEKLSFVSGPQLSKKGGSP